MSRKQVKLALLTAAVLSFLLLPGCGKDAAHYRDVEKKAVRYYQDKYGGKETVKDSFKAGNDGLFGYIGVKDRAYEMSDGCFVYWNDSNEYFADNRQAKEIAQALREEALDPAIEHLGSEVTVTEYSFNRTDMDSFDESVFTEYFDGDISAYCREEKIVLNDFILVMQPEDFREKINRFEAELRPFFGEYPESAEGHRGWNSAQVVVLGENWEGDMPPAEEMSWCSGRTDVRAVARLSFRDGIQWQENVFIEVAPGIRACSAEENFVLYPGDITLEEWGTAGALQKLLDAVYDSMPLDAEENKKGGYVVKDRRHEKRRILKDRGTTVYRAVFSERVLEHFNENGRFPVYLLVEIPDVPQEAALWAYDTKEKEFQMWHIAYNHEDRAHYQTVKESYVFYFGEVLLQELEK